ncbi:MAG: acetylxylan esterase [Bryobacterales bacterium]|nr:acetylxylan esterase [Bryobacterales bacterium]
MRVSFFQLLVALLVPAAHLAAAGDFAEGQRLVLELGNLTAAPARFPAEGFANDGGLEAIYFEGLAWKGRPTRVFAWLGLPQIRDGKVPAIVLVHGGGGTAFREWVEKWTERGYAAISIAVEGQTDEADQVPAGARRSWKRHAWPGPKRDGIYADSSEPLRDQWMYHAVADTVLANSLLRSLPQVDAENVGLMGISGAVSSPPPSSASTRALRLRSPLMDAGIFSTPPTTGERPSAAIDSTARSGTRWCAWIACALQCCGFHGPATQPSRSTLKPLATAPLRARAWFL